MSDIIKWLQNMDDMSSEAKRESFDSLSFFKETTNNEREERSATSPIRRRRRGDKPNTSELALTSNGNQQVMCGAPETVYKAYYTILKIIEGADLCIQDMCQVPEEERMDRVEVDKICFDGILQGVLMHTALADGEFKLDQQLFIEGITQHGSLMKLMQIRTENQNVLTMKYIAAMSYQEQRKFLAEMDERIVREFSRQAVILLVAFEYWNSVSEQGNRVNYLAWICRCFNEIVGYLMQLKGKMSTEETNEAQMAINRLLRMLWLEERKNYAGFNTHQGNVEMED